MKYLSIFYDSYREARDSKVLYFTFAIALLVILVSFSLSFQPVPAEDQVTRLTGNLTFVINFATQGKGPKYSIEEFQRTGGSEEPWTGDYRFFFVIDVADKDMYEAIKKDPSLSAKEVEKQLK